MDSINELESYNLYQEINDIFLLITQMISSDNQGLVIKDTFLVSLNDDLILKDGKTTEDVNIIIKWMNNKKQELLQMINDCIKLTKENYSRFKSENPKIKEEISIRTKDLKKTITFLNNLNLQNPKYDDFKKLKTGPDLSADYAGITVSETKYFFI